MAISTEDGTEEKLGSPGQRCGLGAVCLLPGSPITKMQDLPGSSSDPGIAISEASRPRALVLLGSVLKKRLLLQG